MLAKNNESMQEAVNSIHMVNADEMVRQRCLAREEAERHERTMLRNIKDEDPEMHYDGMRRINARDWLLGLTE